MLTRLNDKSAIQVTIAVVRVTAWQLFSRWKYFHIPFALKTSLENLSRWQPHPRKRKTPVHDVPTVYPFAS